MYCRTSSRPRSVDTLGADRDRYSDLELMSADVSSVMARHAKRVPLLWVRQVAPPLGVFKAKAASEVSERPEIVRSLPRAQELGWLPSAS